MEFDFWCIVAHANGIINIYFALEFKLSFKMIEITHAGNATASLGNVVVKRDWKA